VKSGLEKLKQEYNWQFEMPYSCSVKSLTAFASEDTEKEYETI
jgi:hypothetical protein